MTSITDFIEKYHLDRFDEVLELKSHNKINFYNDLEAMLNTICRILIK